MTKSWLPRSIGATSHGDSGRIVGAIAIHEHQDVTSVGSDGGGVASPAVAAADLQHLSTGTPRSFQGGVGAAAIGDDDPTDQIAGDFGNDRADRFFLVERRDDQRDRALPRQAYKLQRRPQLAQAVGGTSDNRASRKEL